MAAKKRVGRCSRGVSASDLAQMGVCERLVKFERHCGRRRTSDQLQAMDRGCRAHERFYLDRHDDGRSRDRCFVATLVFGEAPETRVLRRFRDQVMRPRPLGRGLIALYYRSGPKVCGFLERRPRLRSIVRWMLSGFASFAARWLEWQEHLHDQ